MGHDLSVDERELSAGQAGAGGGGGPSAAKKKVFSLAREIVLWIIAWLVALQSPIPFTTDQIRRRTSIDRSNSRISVKTLTRQLPIRGEAVTR